MSENYFDQFDEKLENKKSNFFDQFDGNQKKEEKGFLGQAQDAGVSLLNGVVAVPETIVGLADIPTGGQVGKFIEEKTPIQFKQTKDAINDWHTDQYKEQQKQFSEAGQSEDSLAGKVIEKGKVALSNPSMIFNTVVESAPSMLAGGAIGRGLGMASQAIKPITAGAMGEGAVMAGQQAENIRYETDDKLLTPEQSGIALATGAVGSLFGLAGGQVAKKLGFDDLETAMASGRFNSQLVGESIQKMPLSSIPKSIIGGALTEGLLEELPQSVSEQLLQNYALGKPLDEGVDSAIVMGTLAGMAMGGGMNTVSAPMNYLKNNKAYNEQQNTNTQLEQPPSDSQIQYDNGLDFTQPEITQTEKQATEQNPTSYDNQVNFESPKPASDSWTLGESEPESDVEQGNTINYEHPALNTEIQTSTVPDYIFPTQEQTPSQQMGINPDDGPLSTAAALSLDSGATQILNAQTEQNANSTTLTDAAIVSGADIQPMAQSEYTNTTAQDIQHGMSEIAKGAKEAALENTIQRIEKDGEVTLFKEGSIAKALGDQDYNVRLNDDGSASIIGVRNPATNQWHGQEKAVESQEKAVIDNVTTQANESVTPKTVAERFNDAQSKLFTLQQRFNDAKTVSEKAKIRKEINALQQSDAVAQPATEPTVVSDNADQAIVGQDSQNKWFGTQDKADAFVVENGIADTHHVVQMDNKGFEIQLIDKSQGSEIQTSEAQSKLASVVQDEKQLQISELEQQLTTEKSVAKKRQIRKQIAKLQKDSPIDQAAHTAATSIQNDLPEPTQAQIEAGNYKKGHIKVHGLDIAIENPRGSERRGTDPDGNEWAHTMSDHYGYIKRTVGADQENIDTYVGKNHDSDKVFVVDQIDQGTGGFDEHKVMMGFDSQDEAVKAYSSNFDQGWKVGPVKEMSKDQFKDWLKSLDTTKPVLPKNLKESIENIRAEKIRQKNINDLHVGVYGSASIAELENSLNQLSRRIQKNHELSIGEMSGGKRSTRKAVASGAVDNFRKQKMDLEVYLKARKSGEVQQRKKSLPEEAKIKLDEILTEIGLTHHIPSNLWDKALKLSDIIHDLASMKTDGVKTNVLYGKQLLNRIAKLNSHAQIHIVSDLSNIKDKVIRAGLTEGGFFVPEQNTSYIYPKSEAWNSSVLELLNHELVHSVTARSFSNGQVSQENLNKLQGIIELLERYIPRNTKTLSEDIKDRLYYAYNDEHFNELLAVGISESNVREVLKKALGIEGLKQLDSIFTEISTNQHKGYSNEQKQSRDTQGQQGNGIKKISSPTPREAGNDINSATDVSGSQDAGRDIPDLAQDSGSVNTSSQESSNKFNQNKKNDSDEPLYSHSRQSGNQKTGMTVNEVRQILIEHMGEDSINSLEKQGKLNIIQSFSEVQESEDYPPDFSPLGFVKNRNATIVADSAKNKNRVIATFLHELGGHMGFQGVMDESRYKKLMKQFENLVEQGHPLAIEAKEAAENAINKDHQRIEMLPYLITLASEYETTSEAQLTFIGRFIRGLISDIKVWFFDKFGVNLNLQPDDIVELAYIMIDKVNAPNANITDVSERKLYSRRSESKKSSTIQQVREVLVERFGEDVISEFEQQGKLEIIQDYEVEGVEGFYYNGKAVLVASNLTAESTVPTFLHELGGHGGFQNMMGEKQYQELMRQFDKLVEQGNPVAMAAKLLAEREQGSVRQKLEYLPYLLTLSSTMQQRNVIQRNALQKLINNIVAYVKAWAFDRLGINLNLNPDDMLALSERMVDQIRKVSSLDLIRQKYQGTSQWMTAPNGENTHLSEQQWLQVRTPEFKKWFGDWENDSKNASQVLDENGEPKVVYHGTATEFNEFKQGHGLLGDGIYLTDRFDTADMYANIRGNNGFVLPLFVNIRSAFKTSGNVSRDKVVEATRSGKYQGVVHQFDNQEYIVALESNQVKMAEGNAGTFNSESADIRFSRSSNSAIDRLSQNIRDLSIKSIKDKTDYKFKDWLGVGLSALGRRQLTEIYEKLLPQLTKYNELAAQMDADKNEMGSKSDEIAREWSNLKDEEKLADLMHDSTLAKIDPTKAHIHGDDHVKYQQLRRAYSSLSPEAQAMYIKARDAYKDHYGKVQSAIKERILRAALSSQKKADLIKQMDAQFYGYIKGVYFPLARFGKYVVISRNANGDVESISRAETMAEAQKLRSEILQNFPQLKVDRVILDKEFSANRDATSRGFMSNLFDEVSNLGLSTKEKAEFEDTLNQLYLSSMPDLSWAKHGIHRKGTAGFSQDARRAFAQNMSSGASYLAKLRYGDRLASELDAMQKHSTDEAKTNSAFDQVTAQRVIDEMENRHKNLMDPQGHPLSSALTSLGFIYYLGLSPAAAMVNLSQTVLVAYPIMGAKWGFNKAGTELLKASNDFRKGVDFHKPKWNGLKTDWYKTVSSDISQFLTPDEQKAYKEAVDRGVIDVTQAHDLAGIAQGEDSGVMWKTRPIMRAASTLFHSAERFNREVTFIAAYRLARKHVNKDGSQATHDQAFNQAMDATYKGHFDYSSGNRPRIMQGNVAKVLLLFKQFGQNMIYTLARQTYQSIKGETEAERIEARKSLSAILAMHALFAGTLGLPLVGTLLAVASAAGGDDDEPWDAEIALRNYLAEAFGQTTSTLLMKGAPRAFTPIDMSGRVGLDKLIFPDLQEGLEGKKWWDTAASAALGPVGGIGANIAKGTQEMSEGHGMRGVETMLPVFLKNFVKTARYADEGVQDKTGVSVQDEVDTTDLAMQSIGFSPSSVRTSMEGKTAIYNEDRRLSERRSSLMSLWSRAKMQDDQEEMDKIWQEVQGFNEKNPTRRITRINLMQSYKNLQRRIDKAEDGIYLSKKREGARDAGYFAFGE